MTIDFSKTIVVIPTYNERDNIVNLTRAIFEAAPGISILVVDDDSPDGTGLAVEELKNKCQGLDLLQRYGDKGFGRSYIDGFKKVINDDRYETVVMMDADFSHDPKEIPKMIGKISNFDAVVGSRYVNGGRIENWNWRRRLVSKFANFYVKTILRVPISDMTTGFMCFRKDILKSIDPVRSSLAEVPTGLAPLGASETSNGVDLDSIKSDGYAFLVELKYKIFRAGYKIHEHPIVFTERREGQSKMSGKVIWESVWLPWRLKLKTLKIHWPVLVFAAVFGLMITLPYIYHQWVLGSVFQGINRQMADDSLFYLARIRDVIDSHPTLNNAYLAEHKFGWPKQIFLAEYLLAQPLELSGLTVAQGQLVYNFVLPGLTFLLAYLALYQISYSRFWSLAGAWLLLGGLFLFVFFRPVSPQFNFLFWLTQFILAWLIIKNSAWPWVMPLSILNLGLLFYIYPYYWTFYLIFFGLLFFAYWRSERQLSWRFLKISLAGLALGSFYIYYTYLFSKLAGFEETLTRVQMIYSRFPSGIRVVAWAAILLFLILAAWRWRLISMDARTKFFAAGALASVISVNQHLLTGLNFEFSSHFYPLTVFFSIFGLAYLLSKFKGRFGKFLKLFLLLVILFQISSSFGRYFKTAFVFDRSGQDQRYAAVFKWLNQNTPPDSVVYASESLSQLIPVYTANNVFYSRYANLFLLTDAEIYERFILNNYFEKIDDKFVLANERAIFGVRYIDRYGHTVQGNKLRKLLGLKLEPEVYLPKIAVDQFLVLAAKLQSQRFADLIKRYRIDYFVFEKNDPSLKSFLQIKSATKVYEINTFIVYRAGW